MNEIVLAAARMAAKQLHEAKSDKGKTSIADIFDAFLEHIDEQAKRIAEQVGDIKKLKEDLSEVWQVHDEQAKRIAELEAITGVEITDHNLSLIRSILHGEPHTREQRVRAFNLSGKVFRRMQKQHAALKKLGKAKRERGKVLVEERAMVIFCHDPRPDRTEKGNSSEAREQLHREGKL